MARAINILTVRAAAALKEPGRHSDGGGLYLRITTGGARSWVFMTAVGGKRVEIGLGAASSVGLAAARALATDMREAVALGKDPRTVLAPKQAIEAVPVKTFGQFADEYIASVEDGWKNPTHRQQWRNSLRDHAAALTDKALDQITTDDILAVLQPIWLTKAETAGRVRGRIERILDAARARGLIPRDMANPARFKGYLDFLLPKQGGMARGHHAALPYKDVAAFMTALRARSALSARCLEFTILTAARSGEALEATWGEINVADKLWRVPADRMKAGVEHIVPLSDAALAVLDALRPDNVKPTDRIFSINGATRSNMAMAMLLRRMNVNNVTTHGFRSTFCDWAGDCTNYPREIIEAALAHTIQNKAEAAYRRGTAIERRRLLMQEWANYLHQR
ncbi:Prophage integrase IntA [Sphingobium sp. AntQ-1]|uniref:tyrosine-type recombinase/integrase n=1 Tax=Sphingobium sp. AntQ-1 TaxID=2930091 RepID=UPI00234F1DF1|nr:integrase arm-type DNA-binding domain-containing protein [Sphingobium sp. AntQ-1]WCP13574.1 Prophage integrase IntA [Sphingobium sp. AntQ-1]